MIKSKKSYRTSKARNTDFKWASQSICLNMTSVTREHANRSISVMSNYTKTPMVKPTSKQRITPGVSQSFNSAELN